MRAALAHPTFWILECLNTKSGSVLRTFSGQTFVLKSYSLLVGHAVATTCVCQFKWTLRPQTPHPPQPMCPVSSRAGATQSLPRLYSSMVLTTTYKQLQHCYNMLQQHIWSYNHRLCLLFCTIASSPCGQAKKCWGLALTCPDPRHPIGC